MLQKSDNSSNRTTLPPAPDVVLTIAGSDSGGCAGVQADLRTFAAWGLHGVSVVTAVTAQNTRRVLAVHRVPPAAIAAQLAAVFDDFRVAAVKIGMLGGAAAIRCVAGALRAARARRIVVDPVLVSSSGTPLLPPGAIALLRSELLPLAMLATPNVPEAEALLGRRIRGQRDLPHAARDLLALGPRAVLLKGGHLPGRRVLDVLATSGSTVVFGHARIDRQVRGTGCTLASAVAAGLASGLELGEAVARAERFLQACLRRAFRPGRGRCFALGHLHEKSTNPRRRS